MHGTPRFPWLWGGAAHQAAFRAALNTRYHFLPFLYSLAHAARETGAPIALPASYVFPDAPDFPPAVGDATYMVGDVLLPADVSTASRADPDENTTRTNVPPGTWFSFNSTAALRGPVPSLVRRDVPLDALVLYVRAGAIVPLNRDVVQHTGALGGALELHVYAGRDGAFTLVEDDGASLDYAADPGAATRRTAFAWSDAARTLSWVVSGAYGGGSNGYATALPVLFVANASAPIAHAPVALGVSGSVSF